jgi:hypothetical protein
MRPLPITQQLWNRQMTHLPPEIRPFVPQMAYHQSQKSSQSVIAQSVQVCIGCLCKKNNRSSSSESLRTNEIDEARSIGEFVPGSKRLEVICGTARVCLIEHGSDLGQGNFVAGVEKREHALKMADLRGDDIGRCVWHFAWNWYALVCWKR